MGKWWLSGREFVGGVGGGGGEFSDAEERE